MKNAALYLLGAATILLSFSQLTPSPQVQQGHEAIASVRVVGKVETTTLHQPDSPLDYIHST